MRTIANAIIKELYDKNPTLDTIKRYVRVAMATAEAFGNPLTEAQGADIVGMCVAGIPFNPLEDERF